MRSKDLSGDSVTVFVEEEKSKDNETDHADETIGFFAIAQPHTQSF